MTIQKLPDELISQIAAGEVVERPASVVKELIENALDAEAREITVRIENAGKKLIEVSDDGKGIQQEELSLAVQRHATSKLHSAEELFQISTLGFRGEALASVAAISRFTITSRQAESATGGKITIDGGKILSVEETGVPQGTVVHVEDLFYNVPARYAFLKTESTEKNHINNLVYRYALAYPEVRWSLYQDQRPVIRSSGNGNRREILATMYGLAISKEMIEVNLEETPRHIYGFISPVDVTRSNRREMTFFVNGRWVQDAGLSAALYKAYDGYLPPSRYPIAVLFVELSPGEIDVNVHPAKAEVRFQDSQGVFSIVQRAVRRAFLAFTPKDAAVKDAWASSTPTNMGQSTSGVQWGNQNQSQSRTIDPAWQMAADLRNEDGATSEKFAYQSAILPEGMGLLRLIGKMRQGYLLVEGPDGLYLIDERAAQERILFEQLLRQVENTGIQLMELNDSITYPFAGDIEPAIAIFEPIGIKLEAFGTDMVKITSVPDLLSGFERGEIVKNLIKDFLETHFSTPEEATEFLLQRMTFHAGQSFSTGNEVELQRQLVSALQTCQSPRQTADGCATMIHLSLDFMNRQFGRK